jgi:hypothetical protein
MTAPAQVRRDGRALNQFLSLIPTFKISKGREVKRNILNSKKLMERAGMVLAERWCYA